MLFCISPCFFFLFVITKRAFFFLVLIINKFLLSFSPSRRISFLSSSSTCGYNNPRLLTSAYSRLLLSLVSVSCDFLSVSVSLPSSLARSFFCYSSSRIPILSFRRALYALPFFLSTHTSSLFLTLSPSFLSLLSIARLLFILFSLLLTPLFLACLFSSPSYLFLSFSLFHLTHISHFSLRVSSSLSLVFPISSTSRSLFIPRGRPPLSARLFLRFPCHSFTKRTLLSSRSIELRSSSSFYLVKFLVPPHPLLLLLLLLRPQSPPFLSTFLRAVCTSRSIPRDSPGVVRLVLGLSLSSSSPPLSFPLPLSLARWPRAPYLMQKAGAGPTGPLWMGPHDINFKILFGPPPSPPRGRARVCPPPPPLLPRVSRMGLSVCAALMHSEESARSAHLRKLEEIYSRESKFFDNMHIYAWVYTCVRNN